MTPVDVQGKPFVVGQKVARASKMFRVDGPYVVISHVTRIDDGKVYLDDSKRAMNFPERLAIVEM